MQPSSPALSRCGKQLVPLLQAAFSHRGTAILDVISPCVTFNDHVGSTKSYAYVKEHDIVLHTADYIAGGREITVDYEPGTVRDVELEDGAHVLLRKLDVHYDPTDESSALRTIMSRASAASSSPGCCTSIRTSKISARASIW